MKSKPTRSEQDTTCMKCKRIIPKGMTYRQVFDGEKHVGDICYTVCKPGETRTARSLQEQIEKRLAEIKADGRLKELVTINENAPLALVQVQLEGWMSALRWVLKIMKDGE